MSRWLSLIPLAVLALLAILFAGWSLQRDPTYSPDALVGQPAPAAALPLLSAGAGPPEMADLAQAGAGGPVIVNLFASWCAPCRIEHPQLMALQARGVRVVGVAYKDDPADTRAFLDELGDPFAQVLVDRDGRAGLALGVTGVPETFVVGADGTILAKHAGPLVGEGDLTPLLQALEAGR